MAPNNRPLMESSRLKGRRAAIVFQFALPALLNGAGSTRTRRTFSVHKKVRQIHRYVVNLRLWFFWRYLVDKLGLVTYVLV